MTDPNNPGESGAWSASGPWQGGANPQPPHQGQPNTNTGGFAPVPPPGPGSGPMPGYGYPMGPPESNLVLAIVVSIFCCSPLGFVAIAKAAQVEHLWSAGLQQQAHEAAEAAKKWVKYAAIAGGALWAIMVLFYVVMFAVLGTMSSNL